MKRNKLKNNNGITLIKAILLILVTILVVFLAYEIIYVDVFNMMENRIDNPIYTVTSSNTTSREENRVNTNIHTEVITPIIDENYYEVSEIANSVKHYYYNQLDNDGKIIYQGLEDNIDNMKSGNYKIEFKTQFNDLLNSENGEQKLNTAFQSAWNAFTYDYVDIFYIDVTKLILTTQTTTIGSFSTHRVDLSNGNNADYFSKGITSKEEVEEREKYLLDIRKKIVTQLHGYSEYEQVKYVHDWMIDYLEYDTTYQKADIHNVYGAFANGKAVCEGYARSFKYILDGLGIENVLVSGTATNSSGVTETHAWNYVKIDGKWYAIDITWDDPIIKGGGKLTEELRYQYFFKGSEVFFENHKEDGYLSKNSMKFRFPTIEKEDYKY